MDDLRTLALDAALRLDQAARGRVPDAAPVALLGARYAGAAPRRDRDAHRIALAAISAHPPGEDGLDRALVAVGRELVRAAAAPEDTTLQVRCREFCLALYEGLRTPGKPPLDRAA